MRLGGGRPLFLRVMETHRVGDRLSGPLGQLVVGRVRCQGMPRFGWGKYIILVSQDELG